MKTKISISIIFLFISVSLFSQIKRGDKEISLNSNVFYTNLPINETPIKIRMESLAINTEISGRYYFKDFLSVGIGLNYNWKHTEAFSSISTDSTYQETEAVSKLKTIIPSIKLGYNYELIKRFYIKGILSTNYGIASFSEKAIHTWAKMELPGIYMLENSSEIIHKTSEKSDSFNYISIAIQPKLQYYFNDKIGLTLGLGNGEYFENNNLFLFTFGPAYWTLGLDVKF